VTPAATPAQKKWLAFAAKIALTALLLGFLFYSNEMGTGLLDRLSRVTPAQMTIAVLLILGQALLNAIRWQKITALLGHALHFATSLRYVMVGIFFNQTLPSTFGGDAVRWWYACREGIPGLTAFNGLLLDRIIGMLMLALFTLAMLPVVGGVSGRLVPGWIPPVFFVLMLAGVAAMLLVDRLPAGWARFRLLHIAMRLAGDSRRVLLRAWHTPWLIAVSAVAQMLVVIAVYLLAVSLGVPASFTICLFVVPAALLFAALPVSVGGWGVREGAFVVGFGLFGVSATDALAISLLFGVVSMFAGLPGGLVWWLSRAGTGSRRWAGEPVPTDVLSAKEAAR
jgi:hypothetical protein